MARVWSAVLNELIALQKGGRQCQQTKLSRKNGGGLASPQQHQKQAVAMEYTDWMDKFDNRSVESPRTVHSSVLLTTKVRIELQGYQEAPGLPYNTS